MYSGDGGSLGESRGYVDLVLLPVYEKPHTTSLQDRPSPTLIPLIQRRRHSLTSSASLGKAAPTSMQRAPVIFSLHALPVIPTKVATASTANFLFLEPKCPGYKAH